MRSCGDSLQRLDVLDQLRIAKQLNYGGSHVFVDVGESWDRFRVGAEYACLIAQAARLQPFVTLAISAIARSNVGLTEAGHAALPAISLSPYKQALYIRQKRDRFDLKPIAKPQAHSRQLNCAPNRHNHSSSPAARHNAA
jgi:hypothetical protein